MKKQTTARNDTFATARNDAAHCQRVANDAIALRTTFADQITKIKCSADHRMGAARELIRDREPLASAQMLQALADELETLAERIAANARALKY